MDVWMHGMICGGGSGGGNGLVHFATALQAFVFPSTSPPISVNGNFNGLDHEQHTTLIRTIWDW